MKTYEDIGVSIPEVYLPRPGTDLSKWAVVACDQFTSEPEYWHKVEKTVGQAPSTLRMVFPEIYLERPRKEERIQSIQAAMRRYLSDGLLMPRRGLVYVERRVDGKRRRGLLLCLDLERYDYNKGSGSLIRATEGTILNRLPPRMAIRDGAALEVPHILVLIDDPARTVIEPLEADAAQRDLLYDFDLMLGSGHLTGFGLGVHAEDRVIDALRRLARKEAFQAKYGLKDEAPVLLFAMGDGNHSLATAKAVWEKVKLHAPPDHPARYALVEVENVHDEGLQFEPIHRLLFNLKRNLLDALRADFSGDLDYVAVATAQDMVRQVDEARGTKQIVGIVQGGGPDTYAVVEFKRPKSSLAVGTLQDFLDVFLQQGGAEKIDYLHGAAVLQQLGTQPGNAGFYLPQMEKSSLFKTVILDGALPRKTFSMGEAKEKRFYMEARAIV